VSLVDGETSVVLVSDDDDDDDEDDAEPHIGGHASNGNQEKTSNAKRDDSRRRAAHTAAEQKRRNAIRVRANERSCVVVLVDGVFVGVERIRCAAKPRAEQSSARSDQFTEGEQGGHSQTM
jgi:hypothetical protein